MMSLSCYSGAGRQERNSGLHTNFLSQAKMGMKYEYEYHLFHSNSITENVVTMTFFFTTSMFSAIQIIILVHFPFINF